MSFDHARNAELTPEFEILAPQDERLTNPDVSNPDSQDLIASKTASASEATAEQRELATEPQPPIQPSENASALEQNAEPADQSETAASLEPSMENAEELLDPFAVDEATGSTPTVEGVDASQSSALTPLASGAKWQHYLAVGGTGTFYGASLLSTYMAFSILLSLLSGGAGATLSLLGMRIPIATAMSLMGTGLLEGANMSDAYLQHKGAVTGAKRWISQISRALAFVGQGCCYGMVLGQLFFMEVDPTSLGGPALSEQAGGSEPSTALVIKPPTPIHGIFVWTLALAWSFGTAYMIPDALLKAVASLCARQMEQGAGPQSQAALEDVIESVLKEALAEISPSLTEERASDQEGMAEINGEDSAESDATSDTAEAEQEQPTPEKQYSELEVIHIIRTLLAAAERQLQKEQDQNRKKELGLLASGLENYAQQLKSVLGTSDESGDPSRPTVNLGQSELDNLLKTVSLSAQSGHELSVQELWSQLSQSDQEADPTKSSNPDISPVSSVEDRTKETSESEEDLRSLLRQLNGEKGSAAA